MLYNIILKYFHLFNILLEKNTKIWVCPNGRIDYFCPEIRK